MGLKEYVREYLKRKRFGIKRDKNGIPYIMVHCDCGETFREYDVKGRIHKVTSIRCGSCSYKFTH